VQKHIRFSDNSFLLLAQKKGAKKKAADFDAEHLLSQPFPGQNRHDNLNLLEHFASNNEQDGMNCLCWTPDAECVLKISY
jgi:hypothetical protein